MTKSTRRTFLSIVLFLLMLSTVCAGAPVVKDHPKYFVYVGTYTEEGSQSKGIYAYRFDPGTARLDPIGVVAETINPSFLAVHPNQRFIYAVNEVSNYKVQKSGAGSALAIDHANGTLTLLKQGA